MARQTTKPRPQTGRAARSTAARRGRGPSRANSVNSRWLWLAGLVAVIAVIGATLYLRAGRGGSAEGSAIGVLKTADYHALAFSPLNPEVAFFGHHNGVMRSEDGGRTWNALVAKPNFDGMGLGVSRADPSRFYLAGHDIFQASTDGGATWQPVAHNLPGTDIHGFAVSQQDANRLYAFVVGTGAMGSADGGRTWQPLGGSLPPDVMVLTAGGRPETVYAASMRSGVLRSTDGGRSWTPAGSGLGSGMVATVAADPAAGQIVYAGTEGGLFKSTDGGASWSRLPFPGENAAVIAVSPAQSGLLLVISVEDRQGMVYRSEDGGQTWRTDGG